MVIEEPKDSPLGLVVALPGRGVTLNEMYKFMLYSGLNRSIVSIIEPRNLEWYPSPNGPQDQEDAVIGCRLAVNPIKNRIKNLCRTYKIPYSKVAVVGYSAGAVMALEIAQRSKSEMAMVISIAGTILDPRKVPPAKNNTPILMKICRDDERFDWNERHQPAKEALIKNKYNLTLEERNYGGHNLSAEDAHMVYRLLSERFDY